MLKRIAFTLLAAAVCTFGACKKSTAENQAVKKEQFQVKQREQALKNYEKLVAKYPDSAYAAKAQERIRALQAQTPAKK